jgi:hypothetical protein
VGRGTNQPTLLSFLLSFHFTHFSFISADPFLAKLVTNGFILRTSFFVSSELWIEASDLRDGGERDSGAGQGHHTAVSGQTPRRLQGN